MTDTTRPDSTKSPPEPAAAEQASAADATPEAGAQPRDVMLIHGTTSDGQGLQVLRHRNDGLEAGAVRPIRHGQQIHGELVHLKPRADFPLLCDVQVVLPDRTAAARTDEAASSGRRGPPQVATDRYRANWDAIWSRPGDQKLAN